MVLTEVPMLDFSYTKKYSSIIIITHEIKDYYLSKVVKQLSKKNYLVQKPKLIRIEKIK